MNCAHSQHPAERRLEIFMRGVRLPKEERRAIVRHLLTGCARCRVVTHRLWALGEWPSDLKAMMEEIADHVRRSRIELEDGLDGI